jgi:hypothetical protein
MVSILPTRDLQNGSLKREGRARNTLKVVTMVGGSEANQYEDISEDR